jgi:hypothetical protein
MNWYLPRHALQEVAGGMSEKPNAEALDLLRQWWKKGG